MSFIDERIVKMKFDNSEFESKITPTINSINQLNKATDDMGNHARGMDALTKAFSSMEATATQAGFHIRDVWLKVTNVLEYQVARKIVNIGKDIANALTLKGVTDGFQEYELKMGSIQTIMAGTGESLETVNKYLDDLNLYADKTIYSFADMTNNIGKFTNAGVKLKDAVAAIQGVANVAAVSGANTNEASRAMYNFAQALSAGYVKLIDWKSIENANMATVEFKNTLLEVASAIGTVEKTTDGYYKVLSRNAQGKAMDGVMGATKNFNDSLSYQWMTTEVLTKALKAYATDVRELGDAELEAYEKELKALGLTEEQIKNLEELGKKAADAATEIKTFTMLLDTLKEAIGSGWAMTWQLIIGDFNEAKKLWTEVGNVVGGFIDKMSDARNAMLTSWKEMGGRTQLIDALRVSLQALYKIIAPVGQAFREFFPKLTADRLITLTDWVTVFSKKLMEFAKYVSPYVLQVSRGLFAAVEVGIQVVKQFVSAIKPMEPLAKVLGETLLKLVSGLANLVVAFDKVVKKTELFKTMFTVLLGVISMPINFIIKHFDTIVTIITTVGKLASTLFNILKAGFNGVLSLLVSLANGIRKSAPPIQTAGELIKGVFDGINKALDKLQDKIQNVSPIFEGIGSVLGGIANVIGNVLKQIGASLAGTGTAQEGIQTVLNIVYALVSGGIAVKLYQAAKGIGAIGEALDNVGDVLERFGWKLLGEAVLQFAEAIGILAGSLWLITTIDTNKLESSTAALASIVVTLGAVFAGIMYAVKKFDTTAVSKTFKFFGKEINLDVIQFTKLSANLFAASTAIRSMGLAVAEMAVSLKIVASVAEDGHLWDSWAIISLILAELTAVAVGLSKWSGDAVNKGIRGLKSMGLALIEVAAAIKIVASVEDDRLLEAWRTVALLIAEMGAVVVVVERFGQFKLGSMLGLISLAGSVLLLVEAIKQVADALGTNAGHTNRLWDSLKMVSILIAELGAVELILSKFGKHGVSALAASVGMIAAAYAVCELMEPLRKIDKMIAYRGDQMLDDLVVLGLMLTALVAAMKVLSNAKSIFTAVAALSMVAAAEAIVILVGALEKIGKLLREYPDTTFAALVTIAASLVTFHLALTRMTTALPGAAALIVAAEGLVILAHALEKFNEFNPGEVIASLLRFVIAVAAMAGISAILAPIAPALTSFSVALGLAGVALIAFATGCKIMGEAFPSVSNGLEAFLHAVISIIPEVCKAIADGIVIFAKTIVKHGDTIGHAVYEVIRQVLKVIVNSADAFANAALVLIERLLVAIAEHADTIIVAGANVVVALIEGIVSALPTLFGTADTMVIGFGDSLDDSVTNHSSMFVNAGARIGKLLTKELIPTVEKTDFNLTEKVKEMAHNKERLNAIRSGAKSIEEIVREEGGELVGAVDQTGKAIAKTADEAGKDVTETVGDNAEASEEALVTPLEAAKQKVLDLFGPLKDELAKYTNYDFNNLTSGFEDIYRALGLLPPEIEKVGNEADKTAIKLKRMANSGFQILNGQGEYVNVTLDKTEKSIKNTTKATDDYTEALNKLTTATGNTNEAKMKEVSVNSLVGNSVQKFVSLYGDLYSNLENTTPYDIATAAVKKLAIETYNASQATATSTKSTKKSLGEIEKLMNAYTEVWTGVKDSVKSIFSGEGFFQTFEVKTEKTMADLLGAMQSNVNAVDNWSSQMAELGKKGISEGLLKQLAEMGPKGYEYVNAFANATTEEIERANALFAHAGALPNDTADTIMASYANAGIMAVDGFINGIADNTMRAGQQSRNLGIITLKELQTALDEHSPSRKTNQMGKWLCEGLRDGMNESKNLPITAIAFIAVAIVDQAKERLAPSIFRAIGTYAMIALANGMTSTEVEDAMRLTYSRVHYYGEMIGEGLAAGLRSKAAEVKAAAAELAAAAANTTKKENEINSPSKLYRRFGGYMAEGLALGMTDGINSVESSANKMSEVIRNTLAQVETIAEDDMELHPVIAPVLDLSQVKENAGLINALFPGQSMAMASSISIGRTNGYELDNSSNDAQNAAPASINFTQNNYSPKALDRYEIYRQTKNQVALLKGALA